MRLTCVECQQTLDPDSLANRCSCGGLLDVTLAPFDPGDIAKLACGSISGNAFERSGVWRYQYWLPKFPESAIVSKPEGNTNLYCAGQLADWTGIDQLWLKHEGENPTGSFKDRGMTVAISHAVKTGATKVACASTGNTSASVAAYAATAGLAATVFVPEGKISAAKLGQTIAYGAQIMQIRGDFDAAMHLVQRAAQELGIYLLNSINPYRLEGQKTILFELLQQLDWEVPDWIVLPGGNLGNSAAIGKGLIELKSGGVIDRVPRVAVIQASGASPFYEAYRSSWRSFEPMQAETIASAIRIGNPVSYSKARRTVEYSDGIVESVTDEEILEAKARIDRAGIGCEPASAASLAGLRKLVSQNVIPSSASVAGILTGHIMKDAEAVMDYHLGKDSAKRPLANQPVLIDPDLDSLRSVLSDAL